MKNYVVGVVALLTLSGCCSTTPMPTRETQFSEEGYIFYGCCNYGYYNNPCYDMGGPEREGCYTPDCSYSPWR